MSIERNDLAVSTLVQNWIRDLVNTGMSYSRISARLSLSSSTIHKIAKKNRIPHLKTLKIMGSYYLKIFENPHHYGVLVDDYFKKNSEEINKSIIKTKNLIKWLSSMQLTHDS